MDVATKLAKAERAVLVSPAGCGKTESIVRAVSLNRSNLPQLVLTHTNAGVAVLRARFKKCGVSSRLYHIDTIAGWARDYAVSYPCTTGVDRASLHWPSIYKSVSDLLTLAPIRRVIANSYSGVYVDEYQDCTKEQHELVLRLADILPCRVLGDPLQGIFDIDEESRLVDWDHEVFPAFKRLPDLVVPWRWKGCNEELGHWLIKVREALSRGEAIDLQRSPALWVNISGSGPFKMRLQTCYSALKKDGCVIAILQIENQRHRLARSLGGHFSCVERADYRDLIRHAELIDKADGSERAVRVMCFACSCISGLKKELEPIMSALEKGKPLSESMVPPGLLAVMSVLSDKSPQAVGRALGSLLRISHKVFRKDLLYQMQRTIRECGLAEGKSLADVARAVCERTRRSGRALSKRVLGSTFLVKGLEASHCIILDSEALTVNDLYVAMTRGSNSLTVLSKDPVLKPAPNRRAKKRRL